MDTRFAISEYPDAAAVNRQLNELIKKPIYTITPEALAAYEENYVEKKCQKSKAMIEEAKQIIPGGVQHNLAFNYPFPLVFTKAEGAYLYDIDGNKYYDFLQAGGPTVLGSNPPEVREQVIQQINAVDATHTEAYQRNILSKFLERMRESTEVGNNGEEPAKHIGAYCSLVWCIFFGY